MGTFEEYKLPVEFEDGMGLRTVVTVGVKKFLISELRRDKLQHTRIFPYIDGKVVYMTDTPLFEDTDAALAWLYRESR